MLGFFACSTFYSGYGNERDDSLCIVVAIAIMMSSDSLPFSSIAYLSHTLSFSSQGRVPLVKLHTLHGTTERAQCSWDRSHWAAFVRFIAAETAQWRDSACCRRMMSVSQQGQPSLRSGRVFGIPFQAHRFAKTHNLWLMVPILAIHLGSTRHVLVASEPDRHHPEQYCPSIVLTPKENRSYP